MSEDFTYRNCCKVKPLKFQQKDILKQELYNKSGSVFETVVISISNQQQIRRIGSGFINKLINYCGLGTKLYERLDNADVGYVL